MTLERKRHIMTVIKYVVLILVGIIMIYPLVWMVGASFKTNAEIFSGIGFIPKHPTTQGYIDALKGYGGDINIWTSMLNTYKIVIPKVVLTIVSCTFTAYGFAQDTYFVFMLIQFLRNIPKELDEAAKIDGCSALGTLWHVIVPVLKPAMTSAALFQFMWSSNDFMGPLLYVSTPKRYPAAIFVKMSMDADTGFSWNRILALSLISIIPSLVVFFLAQDQFIDGVTAGSVKG